MDYKEHSVKQDPATHILASRTMFEADSDRAWRVYPSNMKPHFVAYQDVEHWTDLVEKSTD